MAVDDGIVVLVPDPGVFVDLNGSAAEIFLTLEVAHWDAAVAAQILGDANDLDLVAARAFVDDVIDGLRRKHVLRDL